jgi:hypothetical protein
MWFKARSTTSMRTPSRCMPLAHVRRRSCKRQGGTLAPICSSSARLHLLQPLIGLVPVVVNT